MERIFEESSNTVCGYFKISTAFTHQLNECVTRDTNNIFILVFMSLV